ncbi:MAG: ComEC family competence protein [Saprospiraceae bacterium]|nr:ComEC family competence protein [Saprospiraceae bacterium]
MTLNWRAAPFVRLFPSFALGIGLASFTSFQLSTWTLPALLGLLVLMHRSKLLPNQQWWFGVPLYVFLFCLGYSLYQKQLAHVYPSGLKSREGTEVSAVGKILQAEPGNRFTRIGLRLDALYSTEGSDSCTGGRILLYLPDSTTHFNIGDRLEFRGNIQEIPGPKNPKAFDFAGYMNGQGYYLQAFVKAGEWRHLPRAQVMNMVQSTQQLKAYCLGVLQEHLRTPETYAIGAALITGHREALSPALRSSYANTGAMHVLAVSGLHVGLIYLGLQYLLACLGNWYGNWKWLRVGLLLMGIWGFVYFTGATASVVRAGCMFSFIVIGQALKRYTNIYNTIAASAFCMLLINPRLLLNIGFQLSYLALLGIIFFQPFIYRALYFRSRGLDYCWKLSSVALAAQLTTLPISLFYFHQFPVYFLLSGLIVVPAAMAILSLGISLFILASVPYLGSMLGGLLFLIIKAMNAVIFFLEDLPFSTLTDIWIPLGGILCLFLGISLLAAFLLAPAKKLAYALCCTLLALCMQISWQSWQQYNHREIVVYQVKGQTVIDCISGRNGLRIIDSTTEEKARTWATDNYLSYRGIKQLETVHWQDASSGPDWHFQGGFLQFRDFRLAILGQLPKASTTTLPFDLVLLHDDPDFELSALLAQIPAQQLVWDGSSSYYRARQWRKACQGLGVKGYDVKEQGALVIEL